MNNNANTVIPFLFGESTIRTMTRESEPWFSAKDVCDLLALGNVSQAVNGNSRAGALGLEDEEKITVTNLDGNPRAGIPHEMLFVSESGLYALIFKSRKAEARAFRKWVTSEVLPAIRKRGFYSHRAAQVEALLRDFMAMGGTFKEASLLVRSVYPPLTRREERQQELAETNSLAQADPEAELFFSLMAPGIEYRVADFFSLLPAGHRILSIKTPRGRATIIGQVMERLVRTGKLRRINARHATYALASEKIVPMER